ncbi:hypothetical protein ACTL6P_12910 [Endozoicomonas acroporae]|uniref:hypothetical protein n=1 Tax=Endozoicomonas acroporae TaxID=1701104 RepID=UPI000C756B39|nr:hypothetical protein [Endozoicomonas acroporae]
MAYVITAPVDFAFGLDAYKPGADFGFYPTARYAFVPPPSVIRFYQGNWKIAVGRQQQREAVYSTSRPVSSSRRQSSQQAKPLEASPFGLFWGAVAKKEAQVSFSHSDSLKKEATADGRWQQAVNIDGHKSQRWDQSIQAKDEKDRILWNRPVVRDSNQISSFRRVDEFSPAYQVEKLGYLIPSLLNFRFAGIPYSPETTPAVYFRMGRSVDAKVIQPRDSKRRFAFQKNRAEDQPVIIPWGFGQKAKDESVTGNYGGETDPVVVEKPEPEQPEIRESYLLMNIITAVVLPARTPLELPSMEISLDIDSFSWSFTGQLWGTSNIALVEPDENGPKQIEVDINGWKWIFIIERYNNTDRRFGAERYTLYGSSRTQLLAAPYAPQRSKSNSTNLNAKQAIIEELAYGDLS